MLFRSALVPTGLRAGAIDVDALGKLVQGTLQLQRATLRHAASGASAEVTGDIAFTSGGPTLALRANWSRLRWPLGAGTSTFTSNAGSATLDGVWPYAFSYQGDVRIVDHAACTQRALEEQDGVTLLPRFDLLGRSVRLAGVGDRVAAVPVGHALQEGGLALLPGEAHEALSRLTDRKHILAIDAFGGHPVGEIGRAHV